MGPSTKHQAGLRFTAFVTAFLICTNVVATRIWGANFPRSAEEVLQAAKKCFENDQIRDQFTAGFVSESAAAKNSFAWFNGFQGRITDETTTEQKSVPLQLETGGIWSVKDVAEPGDVLRIYSTPELGKVRVLLTLVYVGEESFPDSPSQTFSFFLFPYRTQLEYNTLPARMHQEYVRKRLKLKGQTGNDLFESNFPTTDSLRRTRWKRPGAGPLFLNTNLFARNPPLTFDIHRAGEFVNFTPERQDALERARARAIALSGYCVRALADPSTEVKELLKRTFAISDSAQSSTQIAAIRQGYRKNVEALKSARFQFSPPGSLGDAISHAETDSQRRIIKLPTSYFGDGYKDYKSINDDKEFYQTTLLLHEAMHIVNPVTEEDFAASFGGHWGGLVNYLEVAEPVPLGFKYSDAVRNPYAYEFFAIWLRSSKPQFDKLQKAQMASDVFDLLRDEFDYTTILRQEPIDFKNNETVIDGCQYRAHAMAMALKSRYPHLPSRKVFVLGSGYPATKAILLNPSVDTKTLVPYRDNKKIVVVKSDSNGTVIEKTTVKWGYHVALAVKFGDSELVFDPTLFDRPVSVANWLKTQKDTSGSPLQPIFKPVNIFMPSGARDDLHWSEYIP
jgi:hypothetical protein